MHPGEGAGNPVHVLAEHRLVGEAVAAALSDRGREVTTLQWRFGPVRPGRGSQHPGGPRPRTGVLVCELDDPLSLSAARSLVRQDEPACLVVAPAGPDGRWGALLDAGAGGVLPASTDLDELTAALARLEAGEEVLAPTTRAQALEGWRTVPADDRQALARLERLTAREREVLDGLRAGTPAAVLAGQLEVSLTTVRSQVQAILRKLEVGSQIAAVALVVGLEDSELFHR